MLRRTQSTSILWRFSVEGAVFGAVGIALAAALLRVGRRHQPPHVENPEGAPEENRPVLGMMAGVGAGLLAGGLLTWLLGFETLKMQTIFGASIAGIAVGAAAHLAGSAMSHTQPGRTALLAFVTMTVMAVIAPVSALAVSGSGTLKSAYDGSYFPLAAPLALDWLAGALLGIPIGLAWSGAILEKSHP